MLIKNFFAASCRRHGLYLAIALVFVALAPSCGPERLDKSDYMAALNDPDYGLVRERITNGIRIRCKYLPPEFSAMRELRGQKFSAIDFNEAVEHYSQSLTFVLSLTPLEEDHGAGLAMRGVRTYEQFAQRTAQLNFGMEQRLRLLSDDLDLHPVLASLDNSYELNTSRTVLMVFAPNQVGSNLLAGDKLDVVWEDDIFETGIHHFVFDAQELKSAPLLDIGRSIQ